MPKTPIRDLDRSIMHAGDAVPDFSTTRIAQIPVETVYKELETTSIGLAREDVQRRLSQYGPNQLREQSGFPAIRHFLHQFTHFLAILLWIAAGLSFLTEYLEPGKGVSAFGWVIVGVIVINAVFAFVQEYRADRTARVLQRLLPATAWVLRAGRLEEVSREEIVPGDLLLLEEGQRVPADARVVEVFGMRADHSALTGESTPRRRTTGASATDSPTDPSNLVFAGTTIVSGHGRAVVYATGPQTEFGKIAHLSATVEAGPSPLQREIAALSRVVGLVSLVIGLLFFIVSLSMGLGLWISAIFGIGLIAANVPEGLLPTVTFALAMATQRMAKRKALIKHLASVETLGCTTVICTDKTGTLTENRMKVECVYFDGQMFRSEEGGGSSVGRLRRATASDHWTSFFEAIVGCNNARQVRQADGRLVVGDPTEVALVEFALAEGFRREAPLARLNEFPFDPDRKRMTTVHRLDGRLLAFVKGAPESIVPLCTSLARGGAAAPMDVPDRQRLFARSHDFAEQAYRVLAVAMREIPHGLDPSEPEAIERELIFLGLVAMIDPPHREVPEAIARCHAAGIRTVMITGDHPQTALALALKIGLAPSANQAADSTRGYVIQGTQLDAMTDETLQSLLLSSRRGEPEPIFARMAPRQKLRVVSVLKEMGEVVAVTGDGVNDAPSLKKADIGIAMGIAGTDVAKEAADMILLDDNFATIVNAIEEGRAVFANIRKFVTYVFSSNVAELLPYMCYGLFHFPLALTVPQVLAVDLGTNMVPAVALGSERPHQGLMAVPPRRRGERLMDKALFLRVFGFLGLIEGLGALGAFFWFLFGEGWTWGAPLDWSSTLYRQATTVTFAAIVLGQVANAFASRSDRISILQLGFTSNRLTLVGVAVSVLLLALMVYAPIGNWLLGTAQIPFWMWGPLLLVSAGFLVAEEGRKLLAVRLRRTQADLPARSASD